LLYKIIKINLALVIILIVTSCGFQPLYKVNSLSGFIIEEPKKLDENTSMVFSELDRAFYKNDGGNNYIINFTIDEQFEDIDVREDEKVLRKNIVMTVNFTIREQGKKEILYSGESIVSSAFNRVAEPYSNYVSENDTKERITFLLAQDLQRQFILFKNNQLKKNER